MVRLHCAPVTLGARGAGLTSSLESAVTHPRQDPRAGVQIAAFAGLPAYM